MLRFALYCYKALVSMSRWLNSWFSVMITVTPCAGTAIRSRPPSSAARIGSPPTATSARPRPSSPRLTCLSGTRLRGWRARRGSVRGVGLGRGREDQQRGACGLRGILYLLELRMGRDRRERESHPGNHGPVSIGITSALPPLFRNMSVSTMPGCMLATKMFGFSAARNSRNLTCASFELTYAERPGSIAGGRALAPVVTPRIAAWDGLAEGRKAFAVSITPLTLVCEEEGSG